MKPKAFIQHLAAVALIFQASATHAAASTTPDSTVVLMRDMQNMGALVQWTRRVDNCTLQIVMGATSAQLAGAQRNAIPIPVERVQQKPTQAWLLRADGSIIPPLRTSTRKPQNMRETTTEYTYAFPKSASEEAVAAVVMINDNFFVSRLTPFPDP